MILTFERTGGFTAIPLRLTIDTEELDAQERTLLHSQIAEADFFNLPGQGSTSESRVDRFTFTLTVQTDRQNHTIEYGDASIPGPLQPLIDQLSLMARTRRRPE